MVVLGTEVRTVVGVSVHHTTENILCLDSVPVRPDFSESILRHLGPKLGVSVDSGVRKTKNTFRAQDPSLEVPLVTTVLSCTPRGTGRSFSRSNLRSDRRRQSGRRSDW